MCGSFYLSDASAENSYDNIFDFYESLNNNSAKNFKNSWLSVRNDLNNKSTVKSNYTRVSGNSEKESKRAQIKEQILKTVKIKDILNKSENYSNISTITNNTNVIALKHFIANIKVDESSAKKSDDQNLISRNIFNNIIMTRLGNKSKLGECAISLNELNNLELNSLKDVACKCLDLFIEEKYASDNFMSENQVECSDIEPRHTCNNELFTNSNEEIIFKQILACDYKRKDANVFNIDSSRLRNNYGKTVTSAQALRSYIKSKMVS